MRLSAVLTPTRVILITLAGSLLAWLVPGSSLLLRGFDVRAHTSASGWLALGLWYAGCIVVITLGAWLGGQVKAAPALIEIEDTAEFGRNFLLLLTGLAAVGIASTYAEILSKISVRAALASSQGNALSVALSNSAGPQTLRYATVVATAVAIARAIEGRREWALLVGNVIMLAMSALVTSRLSLIMCAAATLYVISRARPQTRIRLTAGLVVVVVGFTALGALNYVRNAKFYEAEHVNNPALMNVYQIETYLGAPMQASAGLSTQLAGGRKVRNPLRQPGSNVLVPTFLQQDKAAKTAEVAAGRYGNVSLQRSLSTNSVVADTYVDYGPTGLLFALLGLALVGALFGYFRQFRGPLTVGAGVCLYCMAELWRVYLPNQGIFSFVMLSVIAAAVLASAWTQSLRKRQTARAVAAQALSLQPASRNLH